MSLLIRASEKCAPVAFTMASTEKAAMHLDYPPKPHMQEDIQLAKQAAEDEHTLGFWEAIQRYPTAAMWSVLVSTAIIMEGYDIVLLSSFYAQPSFKQRYGDYHAATDSYEVSASWQNGLNNAVTVGTSMYYYALAFSLYVWFSERRSVHYS